MLRVLGFFVCLFLSGVNAVAEDVRVMSFNIRYGTASDGENHWEKRKEFLVETIRGYSPDLLGTQETLGFQRDYIQSSLTGYANVGVGREDGGQAGEMTAVFYRKDRFEVLGSGHFWLSESPEVPGSKSWDSSLPRMATWVKLRDLQHEDSAPVLFINTHFDHRGEQARLESARLMRAKALEIGEGCKIVMTGDFNAGVDSQPYKALFGVDPKSESRALVDTYLAKERTESTGEATFSGFKAGVTHGARIDWVAVTPEWEITDSGIDRTSRDGRTPSDHYPVYAVLKHGK